MFYHVKIACYQTALAISSLRSGKDLSDPYKDHPIHQGPTEEDEMLIIIEHDSNLEDEEEQAKAEPNLDTYKPLCLILKHLIALKSRLMKPMIFY